LLLVITGKGHHRANSDDNFVNPEKGILRRVVPNWLKEPPLSNFILAFSSAQKIHGGTGALYVLLRRQIDHHDKG
jgi:DNA-nicking Smr family endonuclease